jgi:hypothetical protein
MRNTTIKSTVVAGLLVSAVTLAGCGSSSGSNSPNPNTVANTNSNVLQLAVGTANYAGTAGLNVVATYRQSSGTLPGGSGALVSSPTLTIPGTLPGPAGTAVFSYDGTATIGTGAAPNEVGKNRMTSTAQAVTNGNLTTFGQTGGVFGLGIEPFNYGYNGTPVNNTPYPVPVYDAASAVVPPGDPNQLPAAWGGVPAFDLLGTGHAANGSGIVPSGVVGISLGLDVFELTPTAGTYTLNVALPGNNGTTSQTVSASLASTALLPAITAPTVELDGAGGGAFSYTLPAGVTEAYIEIVDLGTDSTSGGSQLSNCNGASAGSPIYYTILTRGSGTSELTDTAGPSGAPSLCTSAQNSAAQSPAAATDGDVVYAQVIGFDYPMYEASYPASKGNARPTIKGANGQADITISAATVTTQPAAGADAAKRSRIPASVLHARALERRTPVL